MVELIVDDIMSKVSDHRAHVLMLKEKGGWRRIIVALGLLEAQAIVFALRNVETERPLTHDLFGIFMDEFGITMEYVLINDISDGTFRARRTGRTFQHSYASGRGEGGYRLYVFALYAPERKGVYGLPRCRRG